MLARKNSRPISGGVSGMTVAFHAVKFLAAVFSLALAMVFPANAQNSPPPTFTRDIAPILYRSCASCHHPRGSAPFSLLDYEDAKARAPKIAELTGKRAMPPWLPEPGYGDFANNPSLTDAEIRRIGDWVKNGAPRGPASGSPPPHFSEGWQLGPPDLVLETSHPFTLPASGPDVFWNFIFSPDLQARRFVRAIEVRPGDSHLVHHANVLIDRGMTTGKKPQLDGGFPGMDVTVERSPLDFDSHFLFWKPGSPPWVEPDGFSWELDPGDTLILNAHFMSASMHGGMAMQAKPSIGLYFTEKPPEQFPLLIELQNDRALNIPAGARDFVVADDFRLPVDAEILAVYPHAHYLGHVLEAYATLPNSRQKWLVRIPQWDPAWQGVFHFREPLSLPAGSILSMRWHYDNSSANPRNPHHPPRRVLGGDQSTDEMAHLWLQILPQGGVRQRRQLKESFVRHTLENNPRDYFAHLQLGALMISRLDPGEAVAEFREATRIAPEKAEGHNWLGLALATVGRSREAIEQFRAALSLEPGYTNARYNLARSLAKSGALDEAFNYFSEVIAAEPRDAVARNDFGELLLRMRKPAEALEQFEKAIALDPSLERARTNRDLAQRQSPPLSP